MANAVTDNRRVVGGGNDGGSMRQARLPRWTPEELRVLIHGKKVAENRARGKATGSAHHVAPWTTEPKWVVVSCYCRRHGVDRSPRQCRKRWDNLARDYKRIKVWECRRSAGGGVESFWAMRNERRRERRLPGYFDRVVYELLDGAPGAEREEEGEEEEPGKMGGAAPLPLAAAEEEEGALYDSGRAVAEDGLFSDYEGDEEEEGEEEEGEEQEEERAAAPPPTFATPISEGKPQPYNLDPYESGMGSEEQPAKSTEKGSSSREAHKRKRSSSEDSREHDLQNQIMEILERNSRTLAAHLEAQNIHWQLERDQRKDHTERLVGVLSKLADALGRIADKLPQNGDAKI